MTTNGSLKPIRVAIGSDNAGHAYKEALKETIQKHKGVSEVVDVGVNDPKDGNAYPNIAVDAARKVKNGEVCSLFPLYPAHLVASTNSYSCRLTVRSWSVAPASVLLSPPTRWQVYEQ